MSTCISKDVSCPKCGVVHKRQMWTGMGVAANPELRQKVLNETLFDWKCMECGQEVELVYPCLYHDKNKKIMICVAPDGNMGDVADIFKKYPQLSSVKKRMVSSLAALKEKVLIFESGLDDMAVELVKFALVELVEKKRQKTVQDGFFCLADDHTDVIRFQFFVDGSDQPFRQGTRLDVYHKSCEIVKNTGFVEEDGFIKIDLARAQQLLEEYQDNG